MLLAENEHNIKTAKSVVGIGTNCNIISKYLYTNCNFYTAKCKSCTDFFQFFKVPPYMHYLISWKGRSLEIKNFNRPCIRSGRVRSRD